jgi:uncharacterized protein YhhL (DUF1145 family)
MLTLLKLGCLALYAFGLAALAGWLRGPAAVVLEWLAVAFLAIHVLELPIFWRILRTYRGPFAASVAQALLFGALHSLPLARAARATPA